MLVVHREQYSRVVDAYFTQSTHEALGKSRLGGHADAVITNRATGSHNGSQTADAYCSALALWGAASRITERRRAACCIAVLKHGVIAHGR